MLENKVVLITGGSRGIGRAIAVELASLGADIAIIATHAGERANETLRMIKATGRNAQIYVCNVSSFDEVNQNVTDVVKDFGHIDILVNNAGITRDKLLMQMSEEDISEVLDVNLKGCMYVTKACIRPFLKQRNGRIVNISSVVGLMGNTGQANYAASKAGIIGFTKAVAKEYASKGITCNAIAPGFICTEMTDAMLSESVDSIKKNIPAGRFGQPEDVARLAAFLVGSGSEYITGEVIKVDGGMYI